MGERANAEKRLPIPRQDRADVAVEAKLAASIVVCAVLLYFVRPNRGRLTPGDGKL